jgi:hypothetical protein
VVDEDLAHSLAMFGCAAAEVCVQRGFLGSTVVATTWWGAASAVKLRPMGNRNITAALYCHEEIPVVNRDDGLVH